MTFDEIIEIVKKECAENGVKFYYGKGRTVKHSDGTYCNGYFSDDPAVLAIATNNNSRDILIHEYCHMQQYLEGTEEWNGLDGKGQMWDWLAGDDVAPSVVNESILAHYLIELDCEMRAVAQHEIWDTGINIEEYIQKANAYLMFYFFLRETRKWYDKGKEPYSVESVWRQMPTSFDYDLEEEFFRLKELFNACVS